MRLRLSSGIRYALVLLMGALGFFPALAQAPPRPAQYNVMLRYRIQADRDGRVDQFREMSAYLEKNGFKAAERADSHLDQFDPTAEKLTGTVTADGAYKLMEDPRVKTVVLAPTGYTPPEDNTKPVQVQIWLNSILTGDTQRKLHEQSVERLKQLGLKENIGYDHKQFSRVRGSLPYKTVTELLKDLRRLPAGWFAADQTVEGAELPFRNVLPIRMVEVLPEAPDGTSLVNAPAFTGKIYPDAKALLTVPGKPARLELIMDSAVEGSTKDLRDRLRFYAPSSSLEGVAGAVISVGVLKASEVDALAKMPNVVAIRAPRTTSETATVVAAAKQDANAWMKTAGITRLHENNLKGLGSKVVVLMAEWPGAKDLIGKGLPANTMLIDLTGELTPTLESLPENTTSPSAGAGLAAAVAVAAVAPSAQLVLVRVDAGAFHQLLSVARATAGDRNPTEALRSRIDDFSRQNELFVERRKSVMAEYDAATSNLSDDDKALVRRTAAVAALKKLDGEMVAFQSGFDRLKALKNAMNSLAGATVVLNTLTWDNGIPNDGLNALNAVLEQNYVAAPVTSSIRPGAAKRVPVWVQPASGMVGSVWAGALADKDGNGVMEFAPNTELNFLAMMALDGKKTTTLAAGAKVRLSVQWREPVDADLPNSVPETGLVIRVLKQQDPTGAKAATDEYVEVARTNTPAVKLFGGLGGAVYESTLDATISDAGRYAIRVEVVPTSKTELAARKVKAEIYPRLTVESADVATRAKGRVVFDTVATAEPGVGVPGDSLVALTVGTNVAGLSNLGAGPGMGLRAKPDVLAASEVTVAGKVYAGPAVSAGYVAGTVAAMAGTGAKPLVIIREENKTPGQDLVLPKVWLDTLGNK